MFDLPVKTRPRWRDRIRHFSIGSLGKYDNTSTRSYVPMLSDSALTTPSSSPPYLAKPASDDTSSMLTPLEVRKEDYFTPLSYHKSVQLGNITLLPPHPPPQRKLTYGEPDLTDEFGSKAGPLGNRKTRSFSEGNIDSQVCFICEQPLESKLESEKLLSLQCGDCIHEECFSTIVEYNVSQALKLGELTENSSSQHLKMLLFPTCKGRECSGKRIAPVSPIDESLIESITYEAVLTSKLSRAGKYSNSDMQDIASEDFSTSSDFSTKARSFSTSTFDLDPVVPEGRELPPRLEVPYTSATKPSPRYSVPQMAGYSMSSVSRPVSLALSNVTNATVSVRIPEHKGMSLEHLTNTFIKYMLESCETFDLSMLVALGQLRLVDRLLVSTDFGKYSLSNVYLFANYVVLCLTKVPVLLSFADILSIRTPELSVVEVIFKNGLVTSLRLHSETDSIIEKWGIAVSDPNLEIPPDVFTSTLCVNDLIVRAPQVSPILEESRENSPIESKRRSHNPRELMVSSIAEQYVLMNTTSEMLLLPPISPLKIHKVVALAADDSSDSDSDSDSDGELIAHVMGSIKD